MSRAGAALVAGTLSSVAVAGMAGCGASGGTPVSPALPATGGLAGVPALLSTTWQGYRERFVQADGRVLDPKRGDATTSEGQSYAMLRAAWMGDRDTFARAWRWTQDNLRTSDGLFAYLWGRRGSGWGRLSADSATDADQDVALALLLAARRWGVPQYLAEATTVVRAIWDREVAHAGGTPYVAAGPWAVSTSPGPTLNPSYFAPYAYRLFAEVDGAHPWDQVVDSSYRALDACTTASLGSAHSAGLPPNWCVVDASGAAHPAASMPDHDDYGYDAFRVMWRLAVDALWNGESRAHDYLQRSDLVRTAWRRDHRLAAVYHHDGTPAAQYEDLASYGADLGNLLVTDPQAARQVVEEKLLPSLRRSGGTALWGDPDDYYQQNWVWFGLALSAGRVAPPSP